MLLGPLRAQVLSWNFLYNEKGGREVLFLCFSLSPFFSKNLLSAYYRLELGDIPVKKTHRGVLHYAQEVANSYNIEW